MGVDITGLQKLYETLSGLNLLRGEGPPDVPWDPAHPSAAAVRAAITPVVSRLPLAYRTGYATPVLASLDALIPQLGGDPFTAETIAGAVYDHAHDEIRPQLHQFLAVISNFYRSFLSARKRIGADIPLSTQMPPLAMFQHKADMGPFTITSDQMQQATGSPIGIVSLPSVYRDHPLLWASLAHETGGHDVLHADANLLPELRDGVARLFPGGPIGTGGSVSLQTALGLLWSYWIDEAASDVYGVLNIGPTFTMNLVAFFAALNGTAVPSPTPKLRTVSSHPSDSADLDPHPTDILRIDLARGVVDSLVGLAPATRDAYTAAFDRLSEQVGGTADAVILQGSVRTDNGSGVRFNNKIPMAAMRSAARTVGSYIATARLDALGGHSIQDIETWDDPDEAAAQSVRAAMLSHQSAADAGDDAQLLAGATLAAFAEPEQYRSITGLLADALTVSYARDPIWSPPAPDQVRVETVLVEEFGPGLDIVLA